MCTAYIYAYHAYARETICTYHAYCIRVPDTSQLHLGWRGCALVLVDDLNHTHIAQVFEIIADGVEHHVQLKNESFRLQGDVHAIFPKVDFQTLRVHRGASERERERVRV